MRKMQIVPLSRMEEMRKYLNEYLTELAEFDPDIEFDEKGVPIYKWFDCYWDDKDRFPIYFMVDEKIAGMAMIRELDNMLYEIAEFYIVQNIEKTAMQFGLQPKLQTYLKVNLCFLRDLPTLEPLNFGVNLQIYLNPTSILTTKFGVIGQ